MVPQRIARKLSFSQMKTPPESTGQCTAPQSLLFLVHSPPRPAAPHAPTSTAAPSLHPKHPDRDFDLFIHSVLPEVVHSSKATTRGLQVQVYSDKHAKAGQRWSRKTLVSSTSLHIPGHMAGHERRAQRWRSPPHTLCC